MSFINKKNDFSNSGENPRDLGRLPSFNEGDTKETKQDRGLNYDSKEGVDKGFVFSNFVKSGINKVFTQKTSGDQLLNRSDQEQQSDIYSNSNVRGARIPSDANYVRSQKNDPNLSLQGKNQKQEVVSITYEEIGLFPRSFSRVLDRFLKQIFSDVENLVIQEYRFYRYLFLTTLKCVFILLFVPFLVNFVAKTYVVKPLTEYFWNTKQTEIFLNSYQQKRAFSELKEFEEKTYFESLIFPKSVFKPNLDTFASTEGLLLTAGTPNQIGSSSDSLSNNQSGFDNNIAPFFTPLVDSDQSGVRNTEMLTKSPTKNSTKKMIGGSVPADNTNFYLAPTASDQPASDRPIYATAGASSVGNRSEVVLERTSDVLLDNSGSLASGLENPTAGCSAFGCGAGEFSKMRPGEDVKTNNKKLDEFKQTESLINSYTLKSSLFVYQTQEADKNIQQRYQEKTIELAQRYNDQSIEAITNFFADLISLFTLFYLLYALEIQINITKSFLLEVFFGLDDSKKSLFILLITDLLVGYHSSNLWELFFEFLFHHYGLPESQTGIFLLVATLPVLLDVLFKYLIFRHLNRSSPATVATYHAMIE